MHSVTRACLFSEVNIWPRGFTAVFHYFPGLAVQKLALNSTNTFNFTVPNNHSNLRFIVGKKLVGKVSTNSQIVRQRFGTPLILNSLYPDDFNFCVSSPIPKCNADSLHVNFAVVNLQLTICIKKLENCFLDSHVKLL